MITLGILDKNTWIPCTVRSTELVQYRIHISCLHSYTMSNHTYTGWRSSRHSCITRPTVNTSLETSFCTSRSWTPKSQSCVSTASLIYIIATTLTTGSPQKITSFCCKILFFFNCPEDCPQFRSQKYVTASRTTWRKLYKFNVEFSIWLESRGHKLNLASLLCIFDLPLH